MIDIDDVLVVFVEGRQLEVESWMFILQMFIKLDESFLQLLAYINN